MTTESETTAVNAAPRSWILRVLGIVFVIVGVAWANAFTGVLAAGQAGTFEGARTGAYAVTYILAGIGMLFLTRWAALAAAAWGFVTFSQLFYPPVPRDRVPLLAQVVIALICLFWMVGLVFYINRRTRAVPDNETR